MTTSPKNIERNADCLIWLSCLFWSATVGTYFVCWCLLPLKDTSHNWWEMVDLSCNGWLSGWLIGWVADRLVEWLIDWLSGWLSGWLIGWMIGLVADWLVEWLIDWWSGWLIGGVFDWVVWLIELCGWLSGWLIGCPIFSSKLIRLMNDYWLSRLSLWFFWIYIILVSYLSVLFI